MQSLSPPFQPTTAPAHLARRVTTQGPVPPRAEELDGFIERHRRHIVKLEQVLRLLENEQVRQVL